MRDLPTLSDYRDAIQDPKAAFADPDLRSCVPELDPLGLPRLQSGGFAGTFHLKDPQNGQEWAVRCFYRSPAPDLAERYRYISDFLAQCRCPFFVDFEYQPHGIQVDGRWYPLVKMAWVRGTTLIRAVANHLDQPDLIATLRDRVAELALELETLGVAHGDLSHSNIMVTDSGHLVLVDYDGMYAPGMP
ncbi:MAG: hypothetical protein NZ562_05655, partial [Thermomicrobium sp.]|nr:hypothetical protein [Thermomicrobium sp.]